ncbi:MAG TPA: hypothetical protein VK906_02165 [Egicoccus sp.]|nr:hypothetical protein [Egicoccus sp.]HSK21948.1 hypothetical protein [Egicoccus sp.]
MQTSDRTAASADTPVAGATLVAEAPTAEAALEQVHAAYGSGARIVEAKRVLRGGIGGFFAKEVVQIHAARGSDAPSAPAPSRTTPAPAPGATAPTVGGSPIERLLAEAGDAPDEVDFATFLRRQLAPELAGQSAASAPTAAPRSTDAQARSAAPMHWPTMDDIARPAAQHAEVAAPAPAPVEAPAAPAVAQETGRPSWADAPAGTRVTTQDAADHAPAPTPPTEPAPVPAPAATAPAATASARWQDDDDLAPAEGRAWSRTVLVRLGLPVALVQSLDVAERADDVAWTFALAEALRPLCRPLPSGRALMVGPRARGLATSIGMPVTAVGQPLLALGDVAAGVTGSDASLDWMERARRGRWLHLVIGGKGWRDLLHADPLAVSWASEEDLPVALRAALELGLVLGYGPLGGRADRARPLDVALAIRDLIPVR